MDKQTDDWSAKDLFAQKQEGEKEQDLPANLVEKQTSLISTSSSKEENTHTHKG